MVVRAAVNYTRVVSLLKRQQLLPRVERRSEKAELDC